MLVSNNKVMVDQVVYEFSNNDEAVLVHTLIQHMDNGSAHIICEDFALDIHVKGVA